MSRLPYDYSRCPSFIECPLEDTCLRRLTIKTDPADRQYSYSMFPGGTDCYAYIKDTK